MKITVETVVKAKLDEVWDAWNTPADIMQWNAADASWHTPRATVDLREGGKFVSRMEARDGSAGFDFEGTYTRVRPKQLVAYRMGDGREVAVKFIEQADGIRIEETFDAETENPAELQRGGWQSILDNFRRHVEARG
jgi:uncharacterized protein YndB with AHSA1/START domain